MSFWYVKVGLPRCKAWDKDSCENDLLKECSNVSIYGGSSLEQGKKLSINTVQLECRISLRPRKL